MIFFRNICISICSVLSYNITCRYTATAPYQSDENLPLCILHKVQERWSEIYEQKLIIDGNAVYEIDLDCVNCNADEIYLEEADQQNEKQSEE